jgi:hypothetical protein
MPDNHQSYSGLGLILGGIVAIALAVFLLTGGDLGGTKKVESDADLPKVTSPAPPPPVRNSDSVGTR